MRQKYTFSIDFKVRDYECDLQGIVNNANYQHYYEHARHEFLLQKNVSFADLHEQGIDAVVARIEIAYKKPLRSRDEFYCGVNVRKEGITYIFEQAIVRKSDNALCSKATVTTAILKDGKLQQHLKEFDQLTV